MIAFALLGIVLLVAGLLIIGGIFFVIRRNEQKEMDRNADILDKE